MVHHAAAETATPEAIHAWHLTQGWAGIGYHLYIRLDGSVHAGRPLWASGAQVANHNWHTLGVCCEGDYDKAGAGMPKAQLDALHETLRYLKELYPSAAVKLHRDYGGSVCPGKFFPVGEALAYQAAGADAARTAAEQNESEEDDMTRYNTVSELPEAYRAEIQQLVDKGYLRGKGADALDLTEDMARVLIVCARMEGVV